MRKLVSVLLTLAVAVSLMVVPAVTSASPGAPTIDGIVSAGEWDGATVIDVASGMGTVSVIAHTDYMYVLFNVTDSTDARKGENKVGNDQIGLNINPTSGASWGLPCDIIFQTGADPAAWGGTSSGVTDSWETDWAIDGTQMSLLPTDLETMTVYNYTTHIRISEWKVPLASIGPSAGDTLKVGGAIDVGDGSSYVYPIGLDWANASTYADILVQQPSSAVGLTASVPDIVAISASPSAIDFGTLHPGQTSGEGVVTVTNIGTHIVNVDASVTGSTLFTNNLQLVVSGSWATGPAWTDVITGLLSSKSQNVRTHLVVPSDYTPTGTETGLLVFEATAV